MIDRDAVLRALTPETIGRLDGWAARALHADWGLCARPEQQAPQGDWRTWLILGGRGGGKTRAGAQWVEAQARSTPVIALVGQSLHDVREVMIEGESGLMRLPRLFGERPSWEASRRRLKWTNGAVAQAFSAEDPEALRGPQFGAAWIDEWCAWRRPEETLALLRMGLRLGAQPRLTVTTTPRPIRALRTLMNAPGVVVSRLPTRDNAAHLSPGFLEDLEAHYGGTRLAAQELEGRVVDGEGALWRFADIAGARGTPPDRLDRVVVGVDPPAGTTGAACGIVTVGQAGETAWVLADRSEAGLSPQGWAAAVARAVTQSGATRVVAEANQGGDMVEAVLRAAGVTCPVRRVHARVGKRARAEPVAALYEQGRVRHAGALPELEDELMAVGLETAGTLDRADALVWAVTDLMITPRGGLPRVWML